MPAVAKIITVTEDYLAPGFDPPRRISESQHSNLLNQKESRYTYKDRQDHRTKKIAALFLKLFHFRLVSKSD